MTEDLKAAVSSLVIETVTLRDMLVSTYDDFDPELLPEDFGLNGQAYNGVTRIQTLEDDNEPDMQFIRFIFSSGIRFISNEDRKALKKQEIENEDVIPYIEFKATFSADYKSAVQLTQDQLRAFAKQHVSYHVWPYWREFIQSSCARLNIHPITIPPVRIKLDKEAP
ncbi:hypothetical protein [Vibrio sp. M60_M70]|uniref:hypothetical protein n=1 Tax=Vibrio sp. M60_M70 TaxID=3035166 RepID=UPI00301E0FA5